MSKVCKQAKTFTKLVENEIKPGCKEIKKSMKAVSESIVTSFSIAFARSKRIWCNAADSFGTIGKAICKAFNDAIVHMSDGFEAAMFRMEAIAGDTYHSISGQQLPVTGESETSNPKNQGNNVSMPSHTGTTTTTSGNYQTESAYKILSTSAKNYVDSIIGQYNAGKINKLEANSKLSTYKIKIRKLGGSVPKGSLFLANEPGNPELIGNLGGSSGADVANRGMILEAMETAIYNGMIDAINQNNRSTVNNSNSSNISINGFGLIDKQTLRKLAAMLAPYIDANRKGFITT